MTDSHIHLERGPYTDEWLDKFIDRAVKTGMDEIWLLEHSYLFPEFVPMYDGILGRSRYVDDWFRRKAGKRSLPEYLDFAESGLFNGVAHPDSIKLFGNRPSFDLAPYYDALAATLGRAGMYAEQNSGISRRTGAEAGMSTGLLAAMKRHGVRIMTASDAHCPEDVGKLVTP